MKLNFRRIVTVFLCIESMWLTSCKKTGVKLDMVEIPGLNILMGKTEVTQALYMSVMGENPSKFKGDENPVECIDLYDAIYFCNKLSEKNKKTPVYSVNGSTNVKTWKYTPHKGDKISGTLEQNTSADGYRLPTISEWKYAARGGEPYVFAGSDDLHSVGWYVRNSKESTHQVAQREANAYGLYDMSGNVEEFCLDDVSNLDDRKSYRCGGAFCSYMKYCTVCYVESGSSLRYAEGFRIVCSAGKTDMVIIDAMDSLDIAIINSEIEEKMIPIPGRNFAMMNTEVTQKLYMAVMGLNGSDDENLGSDNPVGNIDWIDAICFCNKLSEKNNKTPVYSVNGSTDIDTWGSLYEFSGKIEQNKNADGYRLPTEEEWVYAARGGQNYKYSGSNDPYEIGWYEYNSGYRVHPVAQKKANGYGLYDMNGNVSEWVWKGYNGHSDGYYQYGAYYEYDADNCCVDSRYTPSNLAELWQTLGIDDYDTGDGHGGTGFRIVCSTFY